MVFPWILLLSVLLPTRTLRIVGMPVVYLAPYFTATSPSPLGNLTLWVGLWLTTCTAVTLLIPQFTTVAAFIIFVVKDMRKWWMRTDRAN